MMADTLGGIKPPWEQFRGPRQRRRQAAAVQGASRILILRGERVDEDLCGKAQKL